MAVVWTGAKRDTRQGKEHWWTWLTFFEASANSDFTLMVRSEAEDPAVLREFKVTAVHRVHEGLW